MTSPSGSSRRRVHEAPIVLSRDLPGLLRRVAARDQLHAGLLLQDLVLLHLPDPGPGPAGHRSGRGLRGALRQAPVPVSGAPAPADLAARRRRDRGRLLRGGRRRAQHLRPAREPRPAGAPGAGVRRALQQLPGGGADDRAHLHGPARGPEPPLLRGSGRGRHRLRRRHSVHGLAHAAGLRARERRGPGAFGPAARGFRDPPAGPGWRPPGRASRRGEPLGPRPARSRRRFGQDHGRPGDGALGLLARLPALEPRLPRRRAGVAAPPRGDGADPRRRLGLGPLGVRRQPGEARANVRRLEPGVPLRAGTPGSARARSSAQPAASRSSPPSTSAPSGSPPSSSTR